MQLINRKNLLAGSLLLLTFIFSFSTGFTQDIVEAGDHQFWSCGSDSLRQWRLTNNQVSGGLGINRDFQGSIAYCNNTQLAGTPATLYAASLTGQAKVYDGSNWVNPGFSRSLLDIGGHENDLYSAATTSFGAPAQMLEYYDPSSGWSHIVTFPNNEMMAVADVLVDEMGRAWVFTGSTSAFAEKLRCYDRNGNLFADIPCNINTEGAYGAILMNDSIFIAKDGTASFDSNTLLPVRWNSNQTLLEQGIPIPFNTSNPRDLASSTPGNPAVLFTSRTPELELQAHIWPNPCQETIFIDLPNLNQTAQLKLTDLRGKVILQEKINPTSTHQTDVSALPKGVYLLHLSSSKSHSVKKIIKQ